MPVPFTSLEGPLEALAGQVGDIPVLEPRVTGAKEQPQHEHYAALTEFFLQALNNAMM